MHKRKYLGIVIMAGALTSFYCAPSGISPGAQLPEYYNYYSPEQIHDTWIDLNNNGKIEPYENTKLSTEQRVEDLLSRLTLDEKVLQIAMLKKLRGEVCESCGDGGISPAIDRLGIPEFSWYVDESLHGIQGFEPASSPLQHRNCCHLG